MTSPLFLKDRRVTFACIRLASPVGLLTIVASAGQLVAVLWPQDRPSRAPLPALGEANWLPISFDGELRRFDLPCAPAGTPFQRDVWRALDAIPYGQTRSYGAFATDIGRPTAVRAVGAANGRNPLSIITPCHRVVGRNGDLTGFAGGLHAKQWLLAHEARVLAR